MYMYIYHTDIHVHVHVLHNTMYIGSVVVQSVMYEAKTSHTVTQISRLVYNACTEVHLNALIETQVHVANVFKW